MASRLVDRMQGYCPVEPLAGVPTSCVDFLPASAPVRAPLASVCLKHPRSSPWPAPPVRFTRCDLSRHARADRHPPRPLATVGSAGTGAARVFVATEMADFVKAGGLGDVAAALPRAVRGACDSRVLLPGYPEVLQRLPQLQRVGQVSAPACRRARSAWRCRPTAFRSTSCCRPSCTSVRGSPYVDGQGQEWRTTRFDSPRFRMRPRRLRPGVPGWTGRRSCCT